ncbi:hypothetical protein GLOTRDRAFT_136395 [Gloeophyllum trabeum ATCC 11539]|uniref:TOG domain-containing protein n=1 Tax=Gloeophyllum trabeum (strain ATCC 11539 / FP-39264 / Madison 617) TaxID=670483 RepID=S7RXC4_GLOTA|nr:uncharacterized protein GLOTRDRAFT_136395 [Gloeophyllum trabeum ATCC 11539]EPQ59550.1 hypothetical protein GLOTRDRAFT_136395 [Gloeophyllum trabeum ATCC 11539]
MDADDSTLSRLVNQCKSGDVDAKIDAVTKLQAEFESGVEVKILHSESDLWLNPSSQINDPDALINALKACLRISHQHLTTATLSALPPLLPLLISRPVQSRHVNAQSPAASTSSSTSAIIDTSTLRHVLLAFLPSPGVIDRLGDSREKAREKARETLVILGGMAFRSGSGALAKSGSGKGPETPLQIFERYLRESGFASKVWRVREQSILTLVHIRRAHHLFPLRAYLPLLVGALEDGDANVRECARQSVVELFTGPGITDMARSDLKKELTKQGVRKTTADTILTRVFAGGGAGSNPQSDAGSEDGDVRSTGPAGRKPYVPPSLALMNRSKSGPATTTARTVSQSSSAIPSRPASRAAMVVSPPLPTPTSESGTAEVKPVYIASGRDLENEFAAMEKPFEGKETEHNWVARDQSITRVRGMLKTEVHVQYTDIFFAHLKQFLNWSLKTLTSLRTTVSINTCLMYAELATTLGTALDPFCDVLYINLLKMSSLTKKIVAQQSQDTVTTLMHHTSAQPRIIIPILWTTLQDKNVQARVYAIGHVKIYMEVHGARARHAIEAHGGHDILEKCVKKGLADPNPGVRAGSRACFWSFEAVWHDKGQAILAASDATVRKALEKDCPNPQAAAAVLPPKTPTVKKSSVAAAIAATRAKAKAVATAPPTLRHQATSTAHAVRATSPPASGPTSPYGRATSPLGTVSRSISPSSPPRSRVMSTGTRTIGRSASHNAVPGSQHARSVSGPGIRAASPTSPVSSSSSMDPFAARRASPLASSTAGRGLSELRKAMQTALPSSPESTTAHSTPTPAGGRGSTELRRAMQTALPASPENTTAHVPRSSPATVGKPTPGTRRAPLASVVPSATTRQSLLMPKTNGNLDDDSLLMATQIPVPEDSDEDMDIDQSMNLISFSTPYELYPPPAPPSATDSAVRTPVSPKSTDNLLSSPPNERVVEDAMRARAEQAESAAERLLELVDPEEDGAHASPIPPSLLPSSESSGTVKVKAKPAVAAALRNGMAPPATPANRSTAILKQAAMFKDSPAYNGKSASLLDVLQDKKHETGWWLKRKILIDQGTPLKAGQPSERASELEGYISALQSGEADVRTLQKLALLCSENPVANPSASTDGFMDPSSPFIDKTVTLSTRSSEIWSREKRFNRLFNALIQYLNPERSEDELEYGLIVLWEMLENQAPLLEGHESDIFSVMLQVRYCNKLNVLEATNTIRDAATTRIEPVYGVTTLHANLRTFLAAPAPAFATAEAKSTIYAFGLVAMGKFILRLPAEIVEDELPRLRATLIAALNDTTSLIVRESAAACIIAAQLVLRDETHLFALLDGLADEKKNLLTYLFDKHGARGFEQDSSGMERLEREMRRLDTRTSTPVKRA